MYALCSGTDALPCQNSTLQGLVFVFSFVLCFLQFHYCYAQFSCTFYPQTAHYYVQQPKCVCVRPKCVVSVLTVSVAVNNPME